MFRKKKNRTKRSLSCVQVAGGMREVGRAADDTMIRTRREKERGTEEGRRAKRKRVRKEGPLVVDHALGPQLMKLSVEDVYR